MDKLHDEAKEFLMGLCLVFQIIMSSSMLVSQNLKVTKTSSSHLSSSYRARSWSTYGFSDFSECEVSPLLLLVVHSTTDAMPNQSDL